MTLNGPTLYEPLLPLVVKQFLLVGTPVWHTSGIIEQADKDKVIVIHSRYRVVRRMIIVLILVY